MALPAADRADPDLLLRVQFGASLARHTRRKIEHYIARALGRPTSHSSGRKRRRYDSSSDSSYSTDEYDDPGDSGLSIAYYDTGFTLDTTADASEVKVSYTRATHTVLGLDTGAKYGPMNLCFNCSLPGHELPDCPEPPDARRIEDNRVAFNERHPVQFASRLYLVAEHERRMDELRRKYRPGETLSDGLREALGLQEEGDVPEYVRSMRYFGYPPAYLGCEPGQDPLLVREIRRNERARPSVPPPETPTLHIYNDADDYDQLPHGGELERVAGEPKPGGDHVDSDEEGAISDPESYPESEQSGDCQEEGRVYNVPLVRYPGLDLSEFDFASRSQPGRPLRPKTPRRRSDNYHRLRLDRYEGEDRGRDASRRSRSPHRASAFDPPYSDSRHRTPAFDSPYNDSRHRTPAYDPAYTDGRHRSRPYARHDADAYEDHHYAHASGGRDQWDVMLDGYYREADHSYSRERYVDGRDYYDPYYGSMPMPPPMLPPMPPPMPPPPPPLIPPPIPPPDALSFNDDSQGPTTYHSLESSVASPLPQNQNEAAPAATGDRAAAIAPPTGADNVSEYDSDVEDGEVDMEESD
ncbi:hypothetical protein GGI15_001749 [Coemansia interrupta]|uniref:CCHC-type domain-containing protein n=1 Tax=Coemansia interrupta TaxID=1126814 RepID=A0A9W8HP96_9FUNG|nr:hypothetical protein GGI15_001749 [Coemansia interrupta]